ncbi:MAG: hypothetical protein R2883_01860 [Caldisericia bacterium]
MEESSTSTELILPVAAKFMIVAPEAGTLIHVVAVGQPAPVCAS